MLESPPPASPHGLPSSPRAGGEILARLLVRRGIISETQHRHARRVQGKLVSDRSLIEILKELRQLTERQLAEALRDEPPDIRLGELLVELGRLRRGELEAALAIQLETGQGRKLGEILVEYGFIAEPQLIEILAGQLGFPLATPQFAGLEDRKSVV